MNSFVTGVGWFVIAMLALALACFAVCCVLWLYEKAMERFEFAVAAKTLASAGRSLGATSWWFSESPDTSLAIRIVAERMTNGLGFDSNQMREQWRKGRADSATGDTNV
jgi:apolipoprotein N-acyltransferase